MPDKYEFRRFADNLTHPWFDDASCDLKQIWFSPNRLLLCILCILLLNVDETNLFEPGPDWKYDDVDPDDEAKGPYPNATDFGVVIFDGNGLVPLGEHNGSKRDCTDIPIFDYLGNDKKNVFHTQLMIGVMFGFMMRCRIPILLTVLNFIVRSGGSFKPKIIPMFIDNTTIRPKASYGSSYNLLGGRQREEMPFFEADKENEDNKGDKEDECSSSDDEDDTETDGGGLDSTDREVQYDFVRSVLPKTLFSE